MVANNNYYYSLSLISSRFSHSRPAQQTVVLEEIPETLHQVNNEQEAVNNRSSSSANHPESGVATDNTLSCQNQWRDHYELDLALSLTLWPNDKEQDLNDHEEPAEVDHSSHHNER